MKKLVLVVAMFMFVCGGSFFAMAQEPVTAQPVSSFETVATDTIVKDTTATQPVKEEVKNDTTVTSLAK